MNIYFDENMSPYLAEGFDALQKPENIKLSEPVEVRSIKAHFGKGAADEVWIPKVGKEGACVITQDFNIRRIKHQKELCDQYNLGIFYFKPPSKNGFKYWDMVKLTFKHWEDIVKISISETRPFSYKVPPRGKMEKL